MCNNYSNNNNNNNNDNNKNDNNIATKKALLSPKLHEMSDVNSNG